MKTRSRDDRCIREAKVFQIATVISVTVRTMGSNLRRVWEDACLELGILPKFLPCRYGIRITQRRRPRVGIFLLECVRVENFLRVTGKKIEAHYSEAACDTIRMVESEPNCVAALNNNARGKHKRDAECREPTSYSAIALPRLRYSDCVVV